MQWTNPTETDSMERKNCCFNADWEACTERLDHLGVIFSLTAVSARWAPVCFLRRPEDGDRNQGVGNMAMEINGSHQGCSGQAAKQDTPTSFKLVNRNKGRCIFSLCLPRTKNFGLKLQEWP